MSKQLKPDHRGDVLKQIKIRLKTTELIDDAMEIMKIKHNSRAITRSKILARCVEIGIKKVTEEMK